MNKIFNKIFFFWKKPKIIVLADSDQETIKRFISRLLGLSFKIDREILFIDDIKKVDLSGRNYLIFNFDREKAAELKGKTGAQILTFGFQFGADIRATDVIQNGREASSASKGGEPLRGLNFKVNHKGSIVPFWLASTPQISPEATEGQIYAALAAISAGLIFNLNLVEISQALKEMGLTSVTK